jgi:DNA-binding transcriptional ArsR family regulator
LKKIVPDEKLARALRAKQRRDILHLLCDNKKRTVQEIADLVDLSLTAASKHLRLLADYGILGTEQDPPHKYYFLIMPEIKELVTLYDKIVEKM